MRNFASVCYLRVTAVSIGQGSYLAEDTYAFTVLDMSCTGCFHTHLISKPFSCLDRAVQPR
eukprot:2775294-Prymnesium_polylepis.1